MAYTVLARRYRSRTFDEVVGQAHIAQTLKRAIESGRIAHAYLFCGTRGTGKTSMARILAKALNCEKAQGPTPEPCTQCTSCQAIARGEDIDVLEIDAASNTQVDKTREVILDKAQFHPARSRFRIYIIDEVHMLSKASFNALLKTLEEPPPHVKFILATTEPEKILPTILSRCQRYDFRNIPTRQIAQHLKQICDTEQVQAEEDALLMVAKAGAGSMRDALSLLDRLLSLGEKQLTAQAIEQLLGLPRAQLIFDLSQAVGEGKTADVLSQVDAILQGGLSPDSLLQALSEHFRNLLIVRSCGLASGLVEVPGLSPQQLNQQAQQFDPVVLTQNITLLEELRRQLRGSQAGRALLDATLARLSMAGQFASIAQLLEQIDQAAPAQKKKPELNRQPGASASPPAPVAVSPPPSASLQASPPTSDNGDDDLPAPGKVWVADQGPSLAQMLRQHIHSQAPATATAQPQPPPPAAPQDQLPPPKNEAELWSRVLASLEGQPTLRGVLLAAHLQSVTDDQAIVQLPAGHETFVQQWQRNGKKDLLRDLLSRHQGRPLSVQFQVQPAAPSAPQPGPPAAPDIAPMSAPTSSPPPGRPTAQQVEQCRKVPLVRALMDELGATLVRLDEE